MPTIVCRTCGRQIYTTSPLDALFPEERRCPRCGTYLQAERRAGSRRHAERREVQSREADLREPVQSGPGERRAASRRQQGRRRDDRGPAAT